MTKRLFVETYGCQMNEADTELITGLMRHRGYSLAENAESADIVLLNTCAVRDKAEQRIFGRLGWLKTLKKDNPDLVLGVAGCMAERMRDNIVEKAPFVDLVIGPDAYRRLPDMVDSAFSDEVSDFQVDVRLDKREMYSDVQVDRVPGVSGWISIQRGCDKFCSFCIVPFVRGRERSMSPEEVVAQATEMAAQGFSEVTLLGQTVSSYYERGYDFSDLLRSVHEVEGIKRIRYTSPYPNDFSDRLLNTLAELPKVAQHIHLPVQSGSSRLLKDMRRGYSAESFMELIGRVRRILPNHALSTDVIVGYPGETDEDFEGTMALMRSVEFDSAFMFIYSERDGTYAARQRPDDVPMEIKKSRIKRLIDQQERISKKRYAEQIGKTVEVMVQGPSRRNEEQMIGRTSDFKTTILSKDVGQPGDIVTVKIVGATSHTLFSEGL
ncbi:MAG: tRNA (N6-isopentenyl adenosine(37)-C2)-methylthiotransferase MiaB [Bradymonadia bacterium]